MTAQQGLPSATSITFLSKLFTADEAYGILCHSISGNPRREDSPGAGAAAEPLYTSGQALVAAGVGAKVGAEVAGAEHEVSPLALA